MFTDNEVRAMFAYNLRELMKRDHISQTELAKRCGCSISTVNGWLHEVGVPRVPMLNKLTGIFDCKPADLLTDKRNPADPNGVSEAKRKLIDAVAGLSDEECDKLLKIIDALFD